MTTDMPKLQVINFFGGAGVGKSSQAAVLFFTMKQLGYDVELINEYAKEMVWEQHHSIMPDQLYLMAQQHRKQLRLQGQAKYCVTDSPILLNAIYRHMYGEPLYSSLLDQLVVECHQKYHNINIVLLRQPSDFESKGRLQSMQQSIWVDQQVITLLGQLNEPYITVNYRDTTCLDQIMQYVRSKSYES